MERSEAESAAKKRHDRDKRYQAKFYVGIDFYDALLAAQDGKCGACGRPATDFTVSLNIDHEHFKVVARRASSGELSYAPAKWFASTELKNGQQFVAYAMTKDRAIEDVKRMAMPASIRGLLCPGRYTGCNRLMGRVDKPEWLRKVIHYLENPPAAIARAQMVEKYHASVVR
jgi:hypothetical protein